MTSSKSKPQKVSNRIKTQPTGYSAFDDSIILLTLSKIQKCLHDISKYKFQSFSASFFQISKDMNVLSSECKHKDKLNLLILHLHAFDLLQNKKYQEALKIIQSKSSHFSQKTHKILKLSIELLEALILKHLQKQEESKELITKAITHLDLTQLKVKAKSPDQKIIETAILCITITAEHFGKFQSQSFTLEEIYTEAYRISYKYLTQYHKLTQTLFTICRNFSRQETDSIRKSKKKPLKNLKKRHSLEPNSNRYSFKDSKSERSYLNYTIQPKSMNTLNESSYHKGNIRHTVIPKRLKTIVPGIDLREQKELCLSKLYGTDFKEMKEKTPIDKKYLKRGKLSTSFKPSYEPNDAVQMKQLEKISKLYLPKLEVKIKKETQVKKKEKLNAIEVIKYGCALSRLKPHYFDHIKTQEDCANCSSTKNELSSLSNEKQTISVKKFQEIDVPIQKKNNQIPSLFQNIHIQAQLKEKLLIPFKEPSFDSRGPNNSQESCQLI